MSNIYFHLEMSFVNHKPLLYKMMLLILDFKSNYLIWHQGNIIYINILYVFCKLVISTSYSDKKSSRCYIKLFHLAPGKYYNI